MVTGLVTSLPLADNMVLPRVRQFSRWGVLRREAIRRFAEEQIRRFDIRCPGPIRPRRARSRAATCRRRCWPASSPSTRWWCWLPSRRAGSTSAPPASSTSSSSTLRERGRGLLVISEDLEELLALSDRIAVMYEGRIAGVLDAAEASVARLGLLMSGAGGHPC